MVRNSNTRSKTIIPHQLLPQTSNNGYKFKKKKKDSSMASTTWTPRSPERSRNWESWVFECAAELFSRYSDNGETIEVERIVSLTRKNDPATRRLAISLYPVKLAEVLGHATSSKIINQNKFSAILVDTMHRLEVFDKATTSSRRDPDLEALVSNIYEAVSEDPVLSAHSSKLGKTLQKDLWTLSRSSSESKKNSMTAREWLRFAAEYTLRTKLRLRPPLSPCRPIRSPLAEDRPRRPSVLYPEDMIQRSLSAEFKIKDDDNKDGDRRKFSIITVNQIQSDINEIRKALDAERALVREFRSKLTDRDKEIVDLKKEIVILYAERNRSAKHHQSMQQDNMEISRLRDDLVRSQSDCEMLREELRTVREELMKKRKSTTATTTTTTSLTKNKKQEENISLHDLLLKLISESVNKLCSQEHFCKKHVREQLTIPTQTRKKLKHYAVRRFLELEVDVDNVLNAFEYELQLSRFCHKCIGMG